MASRIQLCSSFDEAKHMLDAGLLWLRYANGANGGWFKHTDAGRARLILYELAANDATWWTLDKFAYLVEDDNDN